MCYADHSNLFYFGLHRKYVRLRYRKIKFAIIVASVNLILCLAICGVVQINSEIDAKPQPKANFYVIRDVSTSCNCRVKNF